eukprot:7276323-Alexandrium_andersonii.AAC.1
MLLIRPPASCNIPAMSCGVSFAFYTIITKQSCHLQLAVKSCPCASRLPVSIASLQRLATSCAFVFAASYTVLQLRPAALSPNCCCFPGLPQTIESRVLQPTAGPRNIASFPYYSMLARLRTWD